MRYLAEAYDRLGRFVVSVRYYKRAIEPATYTVELGENCERLLFFLECGLEDGTSHIYAIYDIKLNK